MKEDERLKYVSEKVSMLSDFGVVVSERVYEKLTALYPNEVAIENYTRKLISDSLEK